MKRLMFFTLSMCSLFVVMTSFTAKEENKLVGEWEQYIEMDGMEMLVTYDFRENGMLYQTFEMTNEYPYINIKGVGRCEYTYVDGVVSFMFLAKKIHFSNFEIEGLSEELIEMAKEDIKSSIVNDEQQLIDVEIVGEKLTGIMNGEKVTLTRI